MENSKSISYKISLTGEPGSGKSTVCKLMEERLGDVEVVSVGRLQRSMAGEMGMTTVEFNKYMEAHPEIDLKLDDMVKAYDGVTGRNILFDSRLAWNFVPSAFSVYVTIDLFEAATRVYKACRADEGYSSEREAAEKLNARRNSEVLRYHEYYGLNIKDLFNYDLVVDSTSVSPEEVRDIILREYENYASRRPFNGCYFSPLRLYPLSFAEEGGDITVFNLNGLFFVLSGLNALRRAALNGEGAVSCKLTRGADENYVKENLNPAFLKRWEEECGIKFIRYPEL